MEMIKQIKLLSGPERTVKVGKLFTLTNDISGTVEKIVETERGIDVYIEGKGCAGTIVNAVYFKQSETINIANDVSGGRRGKRGR